MTGKAREGEGAAGDEPQPIPEEIEQIMRRACGDPAQQRSLTREEAQKLVQWNRDHPMALQRPEPTFEVIAAEEIWQAEAHGGPLLAAERLLWWFYHHPAALGNRDEWLSIVHEFSRRLDWYRTGWNDEEGFMDPACEPTRIRTLEDAFPEATGGRLEKAGDDQLRPHPMGVSSAWRFWMAVQAWRAEHSQNGRPGKVRSAWAALANSAEFPYSVSKLSRWYRDARDILRAVSESRQRLRPR